jgi:sensor histidine kinase YesM
MKKPVLKTTFIKLLFWLGANTFVGAVIGFAIGTLLPEADLNRFVTMSILFGNAVGFACGLSALFVLPLYRRFPIALDILLRIVTLIGGGLFGSFLVLMAYPFLLLYQAKYILLLFAIDSLVSLIAGSLLYSFGRMRQQIEESYRQLEEKNRLETRLRELAAQAELKALKAQINPHFLFNALNSISALIVIDPVKAEDTLHQLSGLLRKILDSSGKEWVTLAEELCLLDDYFAIEQVRFGKRLSIEKHIDAASKTVLIPNFILQPLVENAVKHGVERKIEGGTVEIEAHSDEARCFISIIDDGPGIDPKALPAHGHGLALVVERLKLLYQNRAALVMEKRKGGGTRILLTLPRNESENLYSHR